MTLETMHQCLGMSIWDSCNQDAFFYGACLEASTRRAPVRSRSEMPFNPLTLDHSYISVPFTPPSLGDSRYVNYLLMMQQRCALCAFVEKAQFL